MSSVQFFTPSALTRAESASAPALTVEARRRAWGRFQAQLAHAAADARLLGYPLCPLRPDVVVEHAGGTFAVQWLQVDFDTLSPTSVSAVTVTSHATGRAVTFGRVFRKQRRSRVTAKATVRYSSPAGTHGLMEEVAAALVALAAPDLGRLRPCQCTDGDRSPPLSTCTSCGGTGRVG